MSYTLEQAKLDIARLQSQMNAYNRIIKAFPNLLDVRGNIKVSGYFSGDGVEWADWTPAVTHAGGTTDPTSVTIAGARYCQIGKVVHATVEADVVVGSGDRTITLFSYPISKANFYGTGIARQNVTAVGYNPAVVYMAAGGLAVAHGAMARDGVIEFSITYEAA